jgi:hypothetical protein
LNTETEAEFFKTTCCPLVKAFLHTCRQGSTYWKITLSRGGGGKLTADVIFRKNMKRGREKGGKYERKRTKGKINRTKGERKRKKGEERGKKKGKWDAER